MRTMLSGAAAAALLILACPASAKSIKHIAAPAPTFEACYDLGWVRGVHTEQGEWPDWAEQCLAGQVPFKTDEVVLARHKKPKAGHLLPEH